MADKTVSAELARRGMAVALRAGIGGEQFQRLTGIAPHSVVQVDGRIAGSRYLAMLNLLDRLAEPGDLVVPEGDICWSEPFATKIAIVSNAPNLLAAFDHCIAYRPLIGEVDAMSFKRAGDDFEFEFRLDGEARTALMALNSLKGIVQLAQVYRGAGLAQPLIELTGAEPPAWRRLLRGVPCPVRFGQARNRLRFSAPRAQEPYAQHNPMLYQLFRNKADADMRALRQRDSFCARVEDFLAGLMLREQQQVSDASDVSPWAAPSRVLLATCQQFGLSRSALHRRLQKEGSHFQDIYTRVRLAEAKRLLMLDQACLFDISDRLGFSSASVLTRFFSQQTGMTPSHFKSRHCPL